MIPHVNELRGIRDQVRPLAAYYLSRHHAPGTPFQFTSEHLLKIATVLIEELEILRMMAEAMSDPLGKEAVTKFCDYAQKVWDIELMELARQNGQKEIYERQAEA